MVEMNIMHILRASSTKHVELWLCACAAEHKTRFVDWIDADWQYYVRTEKQVAVGVAIKNIYCAMIIMMMIE